MIKDKPHAIDKWAQEATHRPKYNVGGPTGRPADQAGRPTYPWAPPPSDSTWGLLLAGDGGLMRLGCSSPRGSLL